MNDAIQSRSESGVSEVAKTSGLLAAIILHNLVYPLSAAGGAGPVLFYAFYASMFVVATWFLHPGKALRSLALVSGLAVFVAGLTNSYAAIEMSALAVYVSSIAYHLVIIIVLARYIFSTQQVMTEVLLAATSLYLVLGSIFAAIYGVVLCLDPAAFVLSSGTSIEWQQLLYFSYVTLTTLGYGDVLPVSYYAQSVATFQAILGTLYTVLLLARLVGLHASRTD